MHKAYQVILRYKIPWEANSILWLKHRPHKRVYWSMQAILSSISKTFRILIICKPFMKDISSLLFPLPPYVLQNLDQEVRIKQLERNVLSNSSRSINRSAQVKKANLQLRYRVNLDRNLLLFSRICSTKIAANRWSIKTSTISSEITSHFDIPPWNNYPN